MATNSGIIFECGNQTNGYNAISNVISIASGGILETPVLTATNNLNWNYITNNGGIYQFPGSNPVVRSSGSGAGIYLNNGTIAFRGITNADVLCNQSGKPLDSAANMTFAGTNAFRLNAATNRADISQTYTFDPGLGAANFYRLEMINGSTRYRGVAGSALTIGSSVGSGGQMLCTNTTAQVDLVFTNNGTLTIENSTLTLTNSATINGTVVIDQNNLSAAAIAGGAILASNVTLGASSAFQLSGGVGTNLTIMTYSGHLSGTFNSVHLPNGYTIIYGSGNNSAVRVQLSTGTAVFFL